MNKRISMVAVAVALAAASTSSFAADQGAFFINGNLGQSNYHDNTFSNHTDTSTAVRAGYSWQNNAIDFGVEAGYVDLGKASGPLTANNMTVNFSAKVKGPLAGANFKYKFSNKMYVSARGGWFRSNMDASISGFGSDSFHGDGSYIGAGVGYDISRHFSLGVNYDAYHARAKVYGVKAGESIGMISGFAEYRF
ncbi:hypothetical protein B0E46_08335 [Rhodanobacter sp. B04]|uniref:outer membrane protein n=1 Tax=Rhodanobacter sp. B04 TaxID=1945860 RepID=UPI0009861CFA|nr:outer membrane beta-barrel protein [Rhodanobacter sp. B04]OOG63935.1 hypothetical protein B0E46_08335 [Rhodanobacter sp. B04]